MSFSIAPVKSEYPDSYVAAVKPLVAYIEDVLSAQECDHVINLARGEMKRSVVSHSNNAEVSDGRTGSHTWIKHDADETILSIATRIANVVGIPLTNAESLQVIRYGVDQQYRPHFDAYDLSTPTGQRCCKKGGQRLVTALVYLNNVDKGGSTAFPKQNVEILPQKGRMAIFHNTLPGSTKRDPKSLHAGTPVLAGEKWAFNLWFRGRPISEIQDFSHYLDTAVD